MTLGRAHNREGQFTIKWNDAMLNITHRPKWKYIQDRKQKLIRINNKCENAKCHEYQYQVRQLVLIKQQQTTKYGTDSYSGPATVIRVNDNGTLHVREGMLVDTYNIRQIMPYHQ